MDECQAIKQLFTQCDCKSSVLVGLQDVTLPFLAIKADSPAEHEVVPELLLPLPQLLPWAELRTTIPRKAEAETGAAGAQHEEPGELFGVVLPVSPCKAEAEAEVEAEVVAEVEMEIRSPTGIWEPGALFVEPRQPSGNGGVPGPLCVGPRQPSGSGGVRTLSLSSISEQAAERKHITLFEVSSESCLERHCCCISQTRAVPGSSHVQDNLKGDTGDYQPSGGWQQLLERLQAWWPEPFIQQNRTIEALPRAPKKSCLKRRGEKQEVVDRWKPLQSPTKRLDQGNESELLVVPLPVPPGWEVDPELLQEEEEQQQQQQQTLRHNTEQHTPHSTEHTEENFPWDRPDEMQRRAVSFPQSGSIQEVHHLPMTPSTQDIAWNLLPGNH